MRVGYFIRVDPGKLIQFVVCQATEFGASLTPIRVVKFLYLVDLYHARENRGETLTGWPWKFVYALREQYRASSYQLAEEKIQMVRNGAFRKSLPLVDDEDHEEGLSGVAKIGNLESD